MVNIFKRILSMALALCVAVTMLPMTAMAVGTEDGRDKWADGVDQDSVIVYPVTGGNLYFGNYWWEDDTARQEGVHLLSADSSIIEAVIPATVEGNEVVGIDTAAFSECSMMTQLTIPAGIWFGDWPFLRCSSLTDIYYEGTQEEWKHIYDTSSDSELDDVNIHFDAQNSNIAQTAMADWAKAYYDFIVQDRSQSKNSDWQEYVTYELIYIDGDKIPELWINYQIWASGCRLVTFHDGKVSEELLGSGNIEYVEYQNVFHHVYGHMGVMRDTIYAISEDRLTELASGEMIANMDENGFPLDTGYQYSWGGRDCSEQEYKDQINEYVDESTLLKAGGDGGSTYDYDGILKYLEGIKPDKVEESIAPFNQSMFMAELLTDGETSYSIDYYTGQLDLTPAGYFVKACEKNNADLWMEAWDTLSKIMKSADKVSSLDSFVLGEKEMYTAIILQVLKHTSDMSTYNDAKLEMKALTTLESSLGEFMQVNYNVDELDTRSFKDLSKEQTKALNDYLSESFKKKYSNFNKVDDFIKKSDKIVESCDAVMDYVEQLSAFLYLTRCNESMRSVLYELLNHVPDDLDNIPLKSALNDCICVMDIQQEQVFSAWELGTTLFAGKYATKHVIDFFWKGVTEVLKAKYPVVAVVMASYEASALVCNVLFKTDATVEQFAKILCIEKLERITKRTLLDLSDKFQLDHSEQNAVSLIETMRWSFELQIVDCDISYEYVDVVDTAIISKFLSLLDGGNAGDQRSQVKNIISNMQGLTKGTQNEFETVWVEYLVDKYPQEYDHYKKLSEEKNQAYLKEVRISCPVNVYIMDNMGSTAAYVENGIVYSSGTVGVMLNGDEKTFYLPGDVQYKILCNGYATGTMNIAIVEGTPSGEKQQVVAFYDVPVESGSQHECDMSLDIDAETILVNEDGEQITATYDSRREEVKNNVLKVVGGYAITPAGVSLESKVAEGERVEVNAFIPDGAYFVEWQSNKEGVVFSNAEAPNTSAFLPDSDVTITAVVSDKANVKGLELAKILVWIFAISALVILVSAFALVVVHSKKKKRRKPRYLKK